MGLSGWRVTIESQNGCVQVHDRVVPQKNKAMLCDTCFVLDAGNIVNLPRFIVPHVQLVQTKLDVLDTRTSKDSSFIVLPCDVEDVNVQSLRDVLTVNPKLLVPLSNKNQKETCNPSLRNE